MAILHPFGPNAASHRRKGIYKRFARGRSRRALPFFCLARPRWENKTGVCCAIERQVCNQIGFFFACPLLRRAFFVTSSTALQQRQPHCWLPLSASHYSNIIDINIEKRKKKTKRRKCKEQWLEEERLFIHLRFSGRRQFNRTTLHF